MDDRTAEHIEAFLEGPANPPRNGAPQTDRVRRPLELESRQDWNAALRFEAARHARYGRPVSVLLIGVTGRPHNRAVDRTAKAIATVIRAEGRETDRAVRTAALSFRILLPETGGRAARTLSDRLTRAFVADPDGRSDGVALCIEIASAPRGGGTFEDSVAEAEARFASRTDPS